MGVSFGLRQAAILLFSWMLPVLLRLVADVPIGREAWTLYVIPAALLGFSWGLRGTVAATIVSSILVSMVAFWTRTSSELWAAVVLGGVSLFIGLLFEYGRNKEAELRDMIDNLERLVVTDSLTGVFNRRYLFDRLNAEVARARRYNLPVSVIMLDIDDFKTYNDRHGHLAGDVLLQTIAKTIRGALRQEDVVVRYGGDEFAIILTAADARSAWSTAERLRNAVKSAGMSISLGVVTYPQDATTAEELLRRADYYLLAAKAAGKDQAYALQV